MKLYHLSETEGLKILEPRIPKYACGSNEDTSIPHVCFGLSISGCLSALQDIPSKYYVYIPIKNIDIIIPSIEQVKDCKANGEVWSLNPVLVQCIGMIKSYQYIKMKEMYCFCKKYDDDIVARFYYPWRWIIKFRGD